MDLLCVKQQTESEVLMLDGGDVTTVMETETILHRVNLKLLPKLTKCIQTFLETRGGVSWLLLLPWGQEQLQMSYSLCQWQ